MAATMGQAAKALATWGQVFARSPETQAASGAALSGSEALIASEIRKRIKERLKKQQTQQKYGTIGAGVLGALFGPAGALLGQGLGQELGGGSFGRGLGDETLTQLGKEDGGFSKFLQGHDIPKGGTGGAESLTKPPTQGTRKKKYKIGDLFEGPGTDYIGGFFG